LTASTQQSPTVERPSIDLELAQPAFSGPLALLLELIERRRLPITEVSIAEVADQYLERMRALVGIDPEILADFLVIGARLLLLKSRELLPSSPVEAEEPDVAAELQQRLLEYRIFREAAELLRQLEESGRRSYARQPCPEAPPRPEPPLEPVRPDALRAAMLRMLKGLRPKEERLDLPPRVTVQERIDHLMACLSSRSRATFAEVAGRTIPEVVATFLAVLELLRLGTIRAVQEVPFGEIQLSLAEEPDHDTRALPAEDRAMPDGNVPKAAARLR